MARKICPKCGIEGDPSGKFCAQCGSLLVEKESEDADKNTNNNRYANMGTDQQEMQSKFSKFGYFITHMWFRGFDGGEEETSKARYISSPQPLENQMKKFKNLYLIFLACIGIGFWVDAFLAIGLVGLILTYPIDICITEYRMYHLRQLKFWSSPEMTNDSVFERMQPAMLSKYGLYVGKNEEGQAVITINDFCYSIVLNSDSTFCILWNASLKQRLSIRFMRDLVYYKYYKEILGAMGTIAYEVQAQFDIIHSTNNSQTSNFKSENGQAKTNSTSNSSSKQASGNWSHGSYNFSWSTLTNAKINSLAVISSILMIICVFLPYAKVTVFGIVASATLMDGDGWLFLGIAVAVLVLGLMGKDNGVLFVSALAVILTIIEIVNHFKLANDNEINYLIEKEIGYYLMIISTMLMSISGIYRRLASEQN